MGEDTGQLPTLWTLEEVQPSPRPKVLSGRTAETLLGPEIPSPFNSHGVDFFCGAQKKTPRLHLRLHRGGFLLRLTDPSQGEDTPGKTKCSHTANLRSQSPSACNRDLRLVFLPRHTQFKPYRT